ncbi:MAG: hypothetical protein OEZ04_10540, partial [Nitrospinota bacterium]|nr:hypothetical protein [Nitrospinota bacterium]
MKDWYSTRELAGLPGLPGTVQNVTSIAKREGWEKQKRQGRGGGFEYSFNSLPERTRLYFRAQEIKKEQASRPDKYDRDALWEGYELAVTWRKEEAHRRTLALAMFEKLRMGGLSVSEAGTGVARQYEVSVRTIHKWRGRVD